MGNGTAAALGLVLLLLLTQGFGPAELVVVVAIIAVIDGGQMFLDATVNIGMIHTASRGTQDGQPSREALRVGFLTKMAVGLLFAVCTALAATPMSLALVGDTSLTKTIMLAGVAAMIAGLQSHILAVLTSHGAFARLSVVSLFKNGLRIAVSVPLLWQSDPDPVRVAQLICLMTALNLGLSATTVSWAFLRASGGMLEPFRKMMSVNGWLFLSAVAMLAGRLDVWLVGWLSSAEEAGYYAVAAQLCVGVGVVSQALITTFLPTVSRFECKEDLLDFLRRTAQYGAPLVLAPVLAWFLAEPVIGLIFGTAYVSAAPIFVALFTASIMTVIGIPLMMMLLSIDQARIIAIGSIAQTGLRIGLGTITVPLFGGLGLALSDLVSRIVAMSAITRIILKALKTREAAEPSGRDTLAEG
ncbi:lipopolysaccharide biosynthesis protein [Roseovarius sp. S4756]|uniref:lipopolysaccharide biosynthesis protein n=1 Tax=Roseovarius maritimus TaxID=3342637 RepID=UPI003727B974